MAKSRTQNKVGDIARYVGLGYSQSAANCRVLLDEIERLRVANKKLEAQVRSLTYSDAETYHANV